MSSAPSPPSERSEFLLQLLQHAQTLSANPAQAASAAWLLDARRRLAQFWLECADADLATAYQGEGGLAQRTLVQLDLREAAVVAGHMTLRDAELSQARDLLPRFAGGLRGPLEIKHFLAAALYLGPHQLPHPFDLPAIPLWLVNDYLITLLRPPEIFYELGEVQAYADYVRRWVSYLHENVRAHGDHPLWRMAAATFLSHANFIPLYFSKGPLLDLYTMRAAIMDSALRAAGHAVDHRFGPRPADRKRLRLGILSNHFLPQTETYTTLPIYKHLDRSRFEIILYGVSLSGHPLERHLISCADHVVPLPAALPEKVERIRKDDLDILVIASNVTAVTHQVTVLALHKLARAQVITINSPTTTGMRYSTHYVSGKITEGEQAQPRYVEKLLLLEGTGLCADESALEDAPAAVGVPTRAEARIAPEAVVFTSGANFHKIIPEIEHVWAKILAAVPGSYLLLYPFNPNWSHKYPVQSLLERLGATLGRYDVAPERVCIFEAAPSRSDVRARLALADVYLDTFPHAGFFSMLDPLRVGLPIITRQGDTQRGNQGSAILADLGLSELIAADDEAFIRLAITLGQDADLRRRRGEQVRQAMQNRPHLFDSRRFSEQMQEQFLQIAAGL